MMDVYRRSAWSEAEPAGKLMIVILLEYAGDRSIAMGCSPYKFLIRRLKCYPPKSNFPMSFILHGMEKFGHFETEKGTRDGLSRREFRFVENRAFNMKKRPEYRLFRPLGQGRFVDCAGKMF